MITTLRIIWAIVEILLSCQMFYYVFANTGTTYTIITIIYWLWLGLYAWNPFNIFIPK